MKSYINFVDISKTILVELCNVGGGFHQQRWKSIGEAFFIDLAIFRDEQLRAPVAYMDNRLFRPLCFFAFCGIWDFSFSRHKTPQKN